MSEENNEATPQVQHAENVLAEVNKRLDGHRHVTEEEIHKMRQELQQALADLGTKDKQEKDEIRQALAEIKEYHDKLKKDEEEKQRVHESSTTIVVPPSNIPPSSQEGAHGGGSESASPVDGGKRRGSWRHLW